MENRRGCEGFGVCSLTGEGFRDFFLPDAQKLLAVGLALNQFPLAFAFLVENSLEIVLAARYAVNDAGSRIVAGNGLGRDQAVGHLVEPIAGVQHGAIEGRVVGAWIRTHARSIRLRPQPEQGIREGERPAFDTGIAPVVGSAHNFIHVFEFQGKSGEIPALSRNRVPRKG